MKTKQTLIDLETIVRRVVKEEISKEFDSRIINLSTKDDLKRFATKDDLKRFATKDDLKRFATKDDLKYLPTKEEFYSKMDELMGEVKAMREEVMVVTGYKDQIEDHETRITKIETVLTPQ